MDLSNSNTAKNLEAAFGGESMANRKYLFFDPDSGIAPGTAFEDIREDWYCPICNATKKTFIPYEETAAVAA
ncbi:rubredoxin [Rivularia sp. UHCC 0363]|uniref:rubredoxin n=1 Tax=Rivularia sp. UHCC 0363 TaxID=3110244 RepID=UPI003A599AE0